MSDIVCRYPGDRDETLIAYLYDDIEPVARASFEAHLSSCARCRTDLNALGGVRRQLARWAPPEPATSIARLAFPPADLRRRSWRDIPAWAQVAAAMLFLGVAAGIANLDVHYDAQGGLNIHTGWSRASNQQNQANPASQADLANKTDLLALERELRAELRASQQAAAAAPASTHAPASNDAEVLRQVRVLLDQSERRQQSELALRVAAFSNEINMQRQADLRRIDMSLGRFQDSTGVEVLRNRQKLDYLLQRASQQQ